MTTLHLSANRVLLRRAQRLAWRSPWRTSWTGLLVASAVAVGVSAMAISWGGFARTESPARSFGTADAVYTASGVPAADVEAVTAAVRSAAPGAQVVLEQQTAPLLQIGSERTSAEADGSRAGVGSVLGSGRMADWSDPLLDGVIDLVEGREPGPGQVVVTPMLAQQARLAIGDRLHLAGSAGSFEVVGIGTIGSWDDLSFAATDGALASGSAATPIDLRYHVGRPDGAVGQLPAIDPTTVAAPVEGPIYRDAAAAGLDGAASTRPGIRIGSGGATVPVGPLIGGLVEVVVVVGVLAGAAFGIGAARRMRATGLLSANGADRSQLSMAAASEALVVAIPAAVIGIVAAWAIRPLWVGLRLPGWASVLDASLPWMVAGLAMLAAVVAAALGAVLFSRPVRRLSSSALLDGGTGGAAGAGRGARPGPDRISVLGWLALATLAWFALYALVGMAGVVISSRTFVGGAATAAVILLWLVCAFGALRLVRLFLGRDPVGRLVDRDLRRRRIGSIATVLVVATWVFVAVGATATDWFRTGVVQSSVEDGGATSPGSDPGSATTVPDGPTSSVRADGSMSATAAGSSTTIPSPAESGSVLLTSGLGSSEQAGRQGTADWVVAGADPIEPPGTPAPGVVAEIAAELAANGLATQPATVGRWTGECTVCPSGFVPTVLVLQSARGIGLPQATVDLLESGAAVTSFSIDGVESQTVAGVPVRVADVPLSVSAIVLASAVRNGEQLTDNSPALVGDATGLDLSQADDVQRVALANDLTIDSRSLLLSTAGGAISVATRSVPSDWVVWPWLAVLVLVTMVATAAHRREHTEAARVLTVLGAGPRAGRRLSSLTAGSLAGVGVGLGLTAAIVVLGAAAARNETSAFAVDGVGPFDGLWSREATWVLLAALAVPFVVALLARLIPPVRSVHGPGGEMPA